MSSCCFPTLGMSVVENLHTSKCFKKCHIKEEKVGRSDPDFKKMEDMKKQETEDEAGAKKAAKDEEKKNEERLKILVMLTQERDRLRMEEKQRKKMAKYDENAL